MFFPKQPRSRGIAIILALFAVGIVSTAVLEATGWDLSWPGRFYTTGGDRGGWTHGREKPWDLLYDYGEIPTMVLVAAVLILCVAAKWGKVKERYAKSCLVIMLTVALGPGILVSAILKPYWGRPRPAEISTFSGTHEYRKVWNPGGPGAGKSFTCGHCAMAYSLASGVAFYPVHPLLSICMLAGGIGFGTIVGVARIVQGGHFPTDVLWSGILILVLIAALYYLVFRIPEQKNYSRSPASNRKAGTDSPYSRLNP